MFTLPITRRGYTIEKYAFGLLIGMLAWAFSVLISSIYSYVTMEHFQIFMSVILLVQLKFGQTKGNIAMILCFGAISLIAFLGVKLAELLNIDVFGIIDSLSTLGSMTLSAIIIAFVLVCLSISYTVSLQIMKKKQF